MNKKKEELIARIQALYDIPLFDLTPDDVKALQEAEDEIERMGYIEASNSSIYHKKYIKKPWGIGDMFKWGR